MSIDNRGKPRRAVLWSGKLQFGDHEFECQIWNISLGGAKVNVGLPFSEGTDVTLVLKDRGEFAAKVMWRGERNLGLKFEDAPDDIRKAFGNDAIVTLGLDDDDVGVE